MAEKILEVSIMVLEFLMCFDTVTEPELGHLPDPGTLSGTLGPVLYCPLTFHMDST